MSSMPRGDPDGAESPQYYAGAIHQDGNVENSAGASYGSPSKTSDSQVEPVEVYNKKIIPSFANLTEFCKFARSRYGLMLDEHVITDIVDGSHDRHGAMLALLLKWQEKKENDPRQIEKVRERYRMSAQKKQRIEAGHKRLEDVFQDEIIPSFSSPQEFRKFAMASNGLNLHYPYMTQVEVDHNRDSFRQMMTMLHKWRETTRDPSVEKIRDIRDSYK